MILPRPRIRWFWKLLMRLTGQKPSGETVHDMSHEMNVYVGGAKSENYIRIEEVLSIADVAGPEVAIHCIRGAAKESDRRNQELADRGVKTLSCDGCGDSNNVESAKLN